MFRRVLRIATAISAILLAGTFLLVLVGYVLNPWHQFVSLDDSFHVSVWNRGLDSRIVFFNDSAGPYTGSIIGFVGADGKVYPPRGHEEGFGDAWGIYYRYFQWSHATLWTLAVSLWYPMFVFVILPGIQVLRWFTSRRAATRTK